MPAPTTIALNGVPVENYGLTPGALAGWISGPKFTHTTAQILGRAGQVVTSTYAASAPRTVTFTGYLSPTSLSDRRAKLDAILRALSGRVEITTVDDPLRCVYGYLTDMTVRTVGPALLAGQPIAYVDVELTCYDPLWYDVAPRTLALPVVGTAYVIPLAATSVVRRSTLTIYGSVTNPAVTVRSASGVVLAQFRLTGTLTSSESVVVENDPDIATITKWSSGTATDVWSWLNASDWLLSLDPADAATIEISGTGASARLDYFNAYWS